MAPWLSVKCLTSVAMTSVVIVVASVTLAITYNASIFTVRSAAQRLAGSMVDTVATRVSNYKNKTEDASTEIVSMALIEGYMVPIDDPSPDWYVKWMLPMRTLMVSPRPVFNVLAMTTDDGGLIVIGDWWVNKSYVYEYVMSASTLAATGKTALVVKSLRARRNFAPWDVVKQGPGFEPLYWADERDPSYYTSKASLCGSAAARGNAASACAWMPPFVEDFSYPGADFVFEASCCVRNKTGAVLGIAYAVTRLDEIDRFLRNAVTTLNTRLFVVDNHFHLIGSSYNYPVQSFVLANATLAEATAAGCHAADLERNRSHSVKNGKIGCRASVFTYPYAPLQAIATLDAAFLQQPGRDERYGDLAGTRHYYISLRIPSAFLPTFTMNLVLFLPESDVLGSLTDATNSAVVICCLVFAVAAAFANILIHVLFPTLKLIARPHPHRSLDEANKRQSMASDDADDDEAIQLTDVRLPEQLSVKHATMHATSVLPLLRTALIVDVVGFGALCERVAATVLTQQFRAYVERLCDVVQQHGGGVERFLGDCTVSYFGTPTQHEMRAGLCALALQREVRRDPLRTEFAKATDHALRIRCGVATGTVSRGGSCEAAVTASLLLSLNRSWGTEVLMSESTAQACGDAFVLRQLPNSVVCESETAPHHHRGRHTKSSRPSAAAAAAFPAYAFHLVGMQPDAKLSMLHHHQQHAGESGDDDDGPTADAHFFNNAANMPHLTLYQLAKAARRYSSATTADVQWAKLFSAAARHYTAGDITACRLALSSIAHLPAAARGTAASGSPTLQRPYHQRVCFERLQQATASSTPGTALGGPRMSTNDAA